MPAGGTVTAITAQQRRRDRVNIFVDGDYAFSLHVSVAMELSVGQVLAPAEIDAMRQRDAAEMAYQRCLHYLSFRARSEQEIRQYLRGKDVPEEVAGQVVERLRSKNLVDDLDFAHQWVSSRERHRPRSAFALRMELRNKGISDPDIEQALEGVDDEAAALKAASSYVRRLDPDNEQVFRRRLTGFLARRGFTYALARKVTNVLYDEAYHTPPSSKGDEETNTEN